MTNLTEAVAFLNRLPDEARENLKWHREHGSEVFLGEHADDLCGTWARHGAG